ncbi:MAG TPA: helix-turn-helix domain-containing protein [Micromonosporaceae bacterium]|jgi:DNA-binding transcriptional ArsR family regulator|nr:helix-turn-helix domain-containing protein [Micromonosporaceae bacterium]
MRSGRVEGRRSVPEVPNRDLRDPRALRAFAHPVRLRLMEELLTTGPATASELAERVGESAANCSWHLRQLARYGFVEEAGGGAGRQRPWRLVVQTHSWGSGDETPELAVAADAASEMLLEREVAALRTWRAVRRVAPPEWRAGAFVAQSQAYLTADELAAIHREVEALLLRYLPRLSDPESRPPGAHLVRLVAWGAPAQPFPTDPQPTSDPQRAERQS